MATSIHANHCEAFNSALRRRNSAFRRPPALKKGLRLSLLYALSSFFY